MSNDNKPAAAQEAVSPEPYGWHLVSNGNGHQENFTRSPIMTELIKAGMAGTVEVTPLFDHPPPRDSTPAAPGIGQPYSLDADPAGIRALVADAITGTLMVGAQGHTPPPSGHWLEPFWEAARADAALIDSRATPSADVFEAYKTWPVDLRAKLSVYDLRRMNGWAPAANVGDWRIDTSACGPILVYKDCSVIEGEDARYVLSLIHQHQRQSCCTQDGKDWDGNLIDASPKGDIDPLSAAKRPGCNYPSCGCTDASPKGGSDAPDMFWNDADPERAFDSIIELVSQEWSNGSVVAGDVMEIQQAIRLPNIKVRVVESEDDGADYEVAPNTPPGCPKCSGTGFVECGNSGPFVRPGSIQCDCKQATSAEVGS